MYRNMQANWLLHDVSDNIPKKKNKKKNYCTGTPVYSTETKGGGGE